MNTPVLSRRGRGVGILAAVAAATSLLVAAPAQAVERSSSVEAVAASQSVQAAVRKQVRQRDISDKGIKFITGFEGHVVRPSPDPAGFCTVGYGHLIRRGPCTAADHRKYGTVTRKEARALLRKDVLAAEAVLDRQIGRTPVYQAEFDALVSFVFNIGSGNFAISKVREDLRANPVRYGAVPNHFMSFTTGGGQVLPGLVKRRKAEGRLFRTGAYPTS